MPGAKALKTTGTLISESSSGVNSLLLIRFKIKQQSNEGYYTSPRCFVTAALTSRECGRSREEFSFSGPVQLSPSKGQEALGGVSGRGAVGTGGGGVLGLC